MHGDPFGVRCALNVLHQRAAPADKQESADDHRKDRHNKLARRQIVLVKQHGRRRKSQHDQTIPENAGLQEL